MKQKERLWLLGNFIAIGVGANLWVEYNFAIAFAVSYAITVLVDIREQTANEI